MINFHNGLNLGAPSKVESLHMRSLLSILSAFVLLLMASSCHLVWNYYGAGEWEKKIDGPEFTHAIQHYTAYLKHVKHLRLEDSAVYYHDYANTVRMEFTSQDVLELCEARELIVDVVEGLLVEINRNPILAPQLVNYPFTSANLEIYIRFESFEGIYVDPYYVGWVGLEDDIVHFYAFDIKMWQNHEEGSANIWDYRYEPYFKSREIVLYEREAEALFHTALDMDYLPTCLKKEQYCPEERIKPRYFSPYLNRHTFDNPF